MVTVEFRHVSDFRLFRNVHVYRPGEEQGRFRI